MAIAFTAYEFWGDPTGNTTTVSANRTAISDLSLKALSDPTKLYYPYDIQRPPQSTPQDVLGTSFQRFVAFRITGSYTKLKNVKITIVKPATYVKSGGVYTQITDDTVLMYRTTNTYEKPKSTVNTFGNLNGLYDGKCNIITATTDIYPRLSDTSPALATTRPIECLNSPSYWTEFIVLQGLVFPGAYNSVGTFGKTGGTDVGSITGPLLTITADEIGSVTID